MTEIYTKWDKAQESYIDDLRWEAYWRRHPDEWDELNREDDEEEADDE